MASPYPYTVSLMTWYTGRCSWAGSALGLVVTSLHMRAHGATSDNSLRLDLKREKRNEKAVA